MRIALLGGSFNPPHIGHLMNAYYVLATRPVDRVWLMPVHRHPFSKRLAPFDDRVRMCQLAAERFGGAVEVTRIEEEVPGDGRTIDTLEVLLGKHPEHQFSLVIGTDILPERSKWKDFDRIEKLVELIVVNRAGFPAEGVPGPALPEVSSTEVREKLAKGDGAGLAPLVAREVLAFIKERGLYLGS